MPYEPGVLAKISVVQKYPERGRDAAPWVIRMDVSTASGSHKSTRKTERATHELAENCARAWRLEAREQGMEVVRL